MKLFQVLGGEASAIRSVCDLGRCVEAAWVWQSSGCLFAIVAAHYEPKSESHKKNNNSQTQAKPNNCLAIEQRLSLCLNSAKSRARVGVAVGAGGCRHMAPLPNLGTTLRLGNLASLLMHFAHATHPTENAERLQFQNFEL